MMVIDDGPSFPLGRSQTGVSERQIWTIRNDGPNVLKLRTHFTSGRCGFRLWLGQNDFVKPGEPIVVALSRPTPLHDSQAFAAHAEVWTNDPDQPRVKLRVVGKTGVLP
jgi:hypothetical protein